MRVRAELFWLILMTPVLASAQSIDHSAHKAAGDAVRRMQATAVKGAITIDGRLTEAAWRDGEAARDFVQQQPNPGKPASLRTEARIVFDRDAIYIGVRLHDSEPDSIVAQLGRRDVAVQSDWIYVALDSYMDRRSAFQFGLNAAGVKRDLRISDDATEDASWNAVWDGAARVDSAGWVAEFRIPLRQLRFNSGSAAQTWGINYLRVVARSNERSHWSAVPNAANAYVSHFGELVGVQVHSEQRKAEVLPYVSSRLSRAPGSAANPFYRENEVAANLGADLRIGLSSALTLTATANPDFGQVEADPSVVNLSAFETFFPERRPFFVEGAELFRVSGADLFYSRRIGRAPQGALPSATQFADAPEQATILGAAKVTGRSTNGWSIGVLDAVTAREAATLVDVTGTRSEALVEPRTNYLVARAARDFRQGRSALAGMFTATNRDLAGHELSYLRSAAYTGGVSGRHRFRQNRLELSGALLGSHVLGDTAAIGRTQRAAGHNFLRPDAEHLDYDAARTSLTGYSALARFAKVAGGNWRMGLQSQVIAPTFEINDVGFNSQNDRIESNTWINYLNFEPNRFLRRWSVSSHQMGEWTFGRERIELNASLETDLTFNNYWSLNLWGMRHQQGVDPDVLRGGPALFVAGHWMGSFEVISDRRQRLSANLGVFADANDENTSARVNVYGGVRLRPSSRADLEMTPSYGHNINHAQYITRRTVAGAAHYVLGRIEQRTLGVGVRLNYTFTPDVSLELYAQPYVSAGAYDELKAVADARSSDKANRFGIYDAQQLQSQQTADDRIRYVIDANRDGQTDFTLDDPSFNFKQVRSNAVLRWEFRPGSAVFLVWSSERTRSDASGRFDLARDTNRLLGAPGRNVLMIKASYWLGL